MDYEKEYKKLKEEHDTIVTTFENFKESSKTDYDKLKANYDKLSNDSTKEISDLKQANINLYLKIPQNPQEGLEQKTPQETKKITCDDLIKEMKGE